MAARTIHSGATRSSATRSSATQFGATQFGTAQFGTAQFGIAPRRTRPSQQIRKRICRLVPLVLWWALQLLPSAASAQQFIGPGREADVLALLAPYRDGAEVVPGVVLQQVRIEAQRIVLEIQDLQGRRSELVMVAQSGPKAFAIQPSKDAEGTLAVAQAKLAEAVAGHDHGQFFDGTAAIGAPHPGAAKVPLSPVAGPRSAGTEARTGSDARGTHVEQRVESVEFGDLQGVAAGIAWLVLLLAILAKAWRPPRTWITVVAGVVVLAVAAALRRSLPFTPLHADDHAFRELGIALALPELDARAAALLHDYGPAWWQFQRWTVPLFGDHHDAVGRWSAAVGGLAVALAAVTARRVSGRWLAALVGAAVMATAPAAARVAHSESTLVVAQMLVSLALWLASPPTQPGAGRWDLLGVLAALLLLTWGHPLGPVLAVGTGLCAWALSLKPGSAQAPSVTGRHSVALDAQVVELVPDGFGSTADGVTADRRDARPARTLGYPALPSPGADGQLEALALKKDEPESAIPGGSPSLALGSNWAWRAWLPSSPNLIALVAGVAVVGLAALWHWSLRPELMGSRLAVQESSLPVPTAFWSFELWWDRAWAASAFTTSVAALGLGGLWAQRRVHSRALAWWSLLAWVLGSCAVAGAGLVVVACVTDAARYQAPLMAVWLISGAFAMRFADLLPRSQVLIGKGVAAAALLASLVQVVLGATATKALDAQGQGYQVLRRELADERGVLWLVAPDRGAEKRHVIVDVPVGKWSDQGPESRAITLTEYLMLCRNKSAPQPAYVFLGPSCHAVDLPDVSTPCAGLEALLDPAVPVRAGFIKPMGEDDRRGLRGEFHSYARDPLDWRLGKARCPSYF